MEVIRTTKNYYMKISQHQYNAGATTGFSTGSEFPRHEDDVAFEHIKFPPILEDHH
jgi:hypothetical protein